MFYNNYNNKNDPNMNLTAHAKYEGKLGLGNCSNGGWRESGMEYFDKNKKIILFP